MTFRIDYLLLALAWLGFGTARAESPLGKARAAMEKWVETRQLISREKSDWTEEKDMVQRSIEMFESELQRLEQEIEKTSDTHSQVSKERAELEAKNQSLIDARDELVAWVVELEAQAKSLLKILPDPLLDKLKPLISRLPDNPEKTQLSHTQRMQSVIGILNEVEKFNGGFSVFSEIKKDPSGQDVEVKTLYAGLGQAFFVNGSGDYAGVGRPGAEGWNWTAKPELAEPIQKAVAVHESAQPAAFVSLPVSIQ